MKVASSDLIKHYRQQVDAQIKLVQTQFNGMTEAQLNQKSDARSWSALECIHHLNLYADYYVPAINEQINEAIKDTSNPIFKSGWIGGYFAESMKPGKSSMQSPKDKNPVLLKSEIDVTEVNRFLDHLKHYQAILTSAEGVNLNKVRIAITISQFVKLKLGDLLGVLLNHNDRHLAQALKAAQ